MKEQSRLLSICTSTRNAHDYYSCSESIDLSEDLNSELDSSESDDVFPLTPPPAAPLSPSASSHYYYASQLSPMPRRTSSISSVWSGYLTPKGKNRTFLLLSILLLSLVFLEASFHISRAFSGTPGARTPDGFHRRFPRRVILDSTPTDDSEESDGNYVVPHTVSPVTPSIAQTKRVQLHLSDVLISVKTTQKYHDSRLRIILDTWFQLAKEQVFFFTDTEDTKLRDEIGDQLIVTDCPATHGRQALCCKMGAEYDYFMKTDKSWFCHFDDDNYVNVPRLLELLNGYDPLKDWYIGRPSTSKPISMQSRVQGEQVSFWFATGGAGFCLSRALANNLENYMRNGKFAETGEKIRLPDDVTMGYIIEVLLKRKLTVDSRFHSHLETLRSLPLNSLADQVSLSGGSYTTSENSVNVKRLFDNIEDPYRFKSLHCFLFPDSQVCINLLKKSKLLVV